MTNFAKTILGLNKTISVKSKRWKPLRIIEKEVGNEGSKDTHRATND